VRSVRYDGESLVVEVQGEGFAFARLVFQNPRGFRVLDELDLHEFWKDYHCKNGWLYEVEQGGWLELESTRSTFCSGQINHELLEYLIVDDKCISVFAIKPPEIFHLGTNPEQQ
jgi:hypothetical protein